MANGMAVVRRVMPPPSTEVGAEMAVGIITNGVLRYLGWPQQVLKSGAIPEVAVITLIGEEPMVQPLVTEVETVVAAIVMAVKATEHHGKQNTKPTTFFAKVKSAQRPSPATQKKSSNHQLQSEITNYKSLSVKLSFSLKKKKTIN